MRVTALSVALIATIAHTSVAQQPRRTIVRDSTPPDSAYRRSPTRLAVTVEALRTAYRDAAARELVGRARIARLQLDSSLSSYDARVRQRVTGRVAVGERGVSHVLYRVESSYRVQWLDSVGARVDLTGARLGSPMEPQNEREALEQSLTAATLTPVPYLPGQDAMNLGSAPARAEVNDQTIVQPLASGAEAYYTYASGDSMTWTLPDGSRVRLREIAVRPRWPRWNLIVGSFWFDVETAQLVRSAYRFSVPMNVWTSIDERARIDSTRTNPLLERIMKGIISPFQVEISGVTIEYGLFDGRYWLPRARSLQGKQQMSFAHFSFAIEQAFSYDGINRPVSIQAIALNLPNAIPDRAPDSLTGAALRKWRDSVSAARQKVRIAFADSLRKTPCDSTGRRVAGRLRGEVAVAVAYPCDIALLTNSADFDKPLYDANESLFGTAQRDALLADALPFGAQALIRLSELPRPTFRYGLSLTRYNRIEGFSTGISTQQQLGAGYSGIGTLRFGFADREPNVELSLMRSNLARSITLTGYNRLTAANDWGNPLNFGASVSAFLFGRDEGFYYRASGADLRWTTTGDAGFTEWRVFAEQERGAAPRTSYSVGGSFGPNIEATMRSFGGASVRVRHSTGLDLHRLRTITDLRLEAATGGSSYGRAAADITLLRDITQWIPASLTLAAGTTAGQLPPQRRWWLGGIQTVRGQPADTARSGNAFWLSRAELGFGPTAYRTLLFGDLGWAGDRGSFTREVKPISGAGVGFSFYDGLVRLDIARGVHPHGQTQIAAYLGGRF